MVVVLEKNLDWRDIAHIAAGAILALSPAARERIILARRIVEQLVKTGTRAYGITTGVGALSDTVVGENAQIQLSRNIVFSHACGVGELLPPNLIRSIIASQIANISHGHSGLRPQIIDYLLKFLEKDCIPDVPSRGSAGYLMHNAHIALVLIGEGSACVSGKRMNGRDALAVLGLTPLVLQAKEGLSLVNGTACATGLSCVALARAARLLDWLDAAAALTLEAAGCQMTAFDEQVLALRHSDGIAAVGAGLRARLKGSGLIALANGKHIQDALSLRAVPHAHGAAREVFMRSALIVDQELASVTDNPTITGTIEKPVVSSQAHAVGSALGQAADSLAIAVAQVAMMSERRTDRLINPLVSGLPAFLAGDAGSQSGFMIAQYTSAALCNANRRLSAPTATDGGVTSALQEDFLAHPTIAANKLLSVIDNSEYICAIELMTAAQAHDHLADKAKRAQGTDKIYQFVRKYLAYYNDDRPLSGDIEKLRLAIQSNDCPL